MARPLGGPYDSAGMPASVDQLPRSAAGIVVDEAEGILAPWPCRGLPPVSGSRLPCDHGVLGAPLAFPSLMALRRRAP